MPKKPSKGKSSPLPNYIRPAFEAKYRTKSKAAADIGIHHTILSKIFNRRSPAVSEAVINKICKRLGLNEKEAILRLHSARELKRKQFLSKPK